MAKHDENKCIYSFRKVGRVNIVDKTLRASKNAIIGIHMWGKIDYLVHYCGWHFIYDNSANPSSYVSENSDNRNNARAQKKAAKEHKLTDKTKRNKK